MKLHQSLFLNIISLFGYIDLLFQIAFVYSTIFAKIFSIGFSIDIFASLNPIRIPATLILLILAIIEFCVIKIKKCKPLIKINNKIFKISFYITITISLLYTTMILYVLCQFAHAIKFL